MGILSLLSAPIDKIITAVGNAVNENVTSDQERLQLRNALQTIKDNSDVDVKKIQLQYQEELTKRQQLDMTSDSWLSKNIRPLTLAYLIIIVSLFAFTDGNINIGDWHFLVKPEYIDLFKSLLLTGFVFYFGSRGVEKITKIKGTRKDEQ